jgi:pimeloyl-ACP methyl ester carboxylesterase
MLHDDTRGEANVSRRRSRCGSCSKEPRPPSCGRFRAALPSRNRPILLLVERLPVTGALVRMPHMPPDVHYARNGDTALAYQVVGGGSIDVAFLSGFVNNLDLIWEYPPYARFLRRLASFSRLILMDRRGTGLSDRFLPRDLPPLEVLQDDLRLVLDEIGAERPSLFGWSVQVACALSLPQHIRSERAPWPSSTLPYRVGSPTTINCSGPTLNGTHTSRIWRPAGAPASTQRRWLPGSIRRWRATRSRSTGGHGSRDKLRVLTPPSRSTDVPRYRRP